MPGVAEPLVAISAVRTLAGRGKTNNDAGNDVVLDEDRTLILNGETVDKVHLRRERGSCTMVGADPVGVKGGRLE